MLMELPLEFDSDKDRRNRLKHKVSLAEAEQMEWETALVWPDARFDYGEERMIGLGYIGLRLYYVVFVDRDEKRRIISLRKAHPQEMKYYAKTQIWNYFPNA